MSKYDQIFTGLLILIYTRTEKNKFNMNISIEDAIELVKINSNGLLCDDASKNDFYKAINKAKEYIKNSIIKETSALKEYKNIKRNIKISKVATPYIIKCRSNVIEEMTKEMDKEKAKIEHAMECMRKLHEDLK